MWDIGDWVGPISKKEEVFGCVNDILGLFGQICARGKRAGEVVQSLKDNWTVLQLREERLKYQFGEMENCVVEIFPLI